MKNLSKVKIGLAALFLCSGLTALADDSLQIHGFFMNGTDYSAESGRSTVALHRDPNGDPRGKLGDLGNVFWHDYFTAVSLNKKWEGKDGSWADFTYELVSYGNKLVEAGQSYARFGGLSFLPEGSNIWAGRRNLSKRDNVFAYNIKDVGLDAAIGYDGKNLDVTLGYSQANWGAKEPSRNVIDASYTLGAIEAGVTYVKELEEEIWFGHADDPRTGTSFYGAYNMDKFLGVMDGNTMIMAQVGTGVIAQYLNTGRIDNSADDDTSMRVTVNGSTNLGSLSVAPSVIMETTNRAADGMEVETMLAAGANASQKINDNLVMHFEANVNNTTNKDGVDGKDGMAYKIAAGPSIQLDAMPWVAPQITLVASYVGGDKDITGLSEDSEVRFGYEMKAWF